MKKIIALVLALVTVFALAACGAEPKKTETQAETKTAEPAATTEPATEPETTEEDTGVMTYAEFAAAEVGEEVVIEAYVQDHQSWWNNKISVYLQDKDGGYFAYQMTCSEEDAAKLVPGTKIRVTGTKAMWPEVNGEVELGSGCTFEFVEGADTFIATAADVTSLVGTDDLAGKMNQRVVFKGVTITAQEDGTAFNYKNSDDDKDIYFKGTIGENEISFCVENYLRGPSTDVYKAVEGLKVGDKVDVEAYLYWYSGANPHVIAVTAAA